MLMFEDPAPEEPLPPRKKAKISLSSREARRFALITIAIAAVIIAVASSRAHFKLAAHTPGDMPANARWLFTGRDAETNAKVGLWVACWLSPTQMADHCRITDQSGGAQFDGDMLPLNAAQPVVADKDLQIAAIDPSTLWVRGMHGDLPVPMLLLNNGTHLVPVADREGLQKRMARGDWQTGLHPRFRGITQQ